MSCKNFGGLVDPRGVEPLLSDCQPDVIPFHHGPVEYVVYRIVYIV